MQKKREKKWFYKIRVFLDSHSNFKGLRLEKTQYLVDLDLDVIGLNW